MTGKLFLTFLFCAPLIGVNTAFFSFFPFWGNFSTSH